MGSKILLADDSITIQKVVNLTFADEGIEVVSVSNGDMAERRLAEVNPDLVLADIFMPGKNGYELCEAIKQHPQFHDVPVVLLVGAFEPFNESEARRVRADAHLTKPFESRVLVETVKNLIEKSPKPKTAPIPAETLQQQTAPEAQPFQNARPFAMPAIDLSAMSNPPAPQESVFADRLSASSLADSTPFADSFPNNFDLSQNQPPVPQAALEFTVDTSPATPVDTSPASFIETAPASFDTEPSVSAPVVQEFLTSEPVSPYADLFKVENTFPLSENSAPQESAADYGDLFETPSSDVFETPSSLDSAVAVPPASFEVPDHLGNPTQEGAVFESSAEQPILASIENPAADVLVDFEKLEAPQEQDAQVLGSFEVVRAEPAISQAREYQIEEVENVESRVARGFDTNELESPVEGAFSPALNDADIASNGNGAAKDSQMDKEFSFYEGPTESDPSLLSTDEPLGDVFNDFPGAGFGAPAEAAPLDFEAPSGATPVPQIPAPETQPVAETIPQPASEALSQSVAAEVAPLGAFNAGSEAVVVNEVASQEVVSEMPTQDFSFFDPTSSSSAPGVETVAEPSTNGFEVTMPQKVEPIEVETSTPLSTDFNFFTEPEKVETPEAVAPASETVATGDAVAHQTPDQGDKFIASDMWEAQTQFTPVAIESLPVAELPTAPPEESVEGSVQAVPVATIPVAANSPGESAPAEAASPKEENHLAKTIPNEVGMNKEMMDEIVRQVVSQLSDSVIREIAWEVVPDCVERVVTNLTKQDLSRRL